ncbi:hypothetical protein FEM48_Zijuj07G0066000 [Ziziphus jujuba var. spinosa]|uniref:Uncharacterized protein n=1 Tax=Ziziphus jujuba var. spinosa TaxID=714518 RepID=A0A978V321_ZIZJJ|nr:hypothetical protein FEM48_Zijuj07G0066000 [Ziziphus jujuba var. spinosa]
MQTPQLKVGIFRLPALRGGEQVHSFSTTLLPDYHTKKFILIRRTASGKVSVLTDDRSGGVADVDDELDYWVKQDQLLLGWIRATISCEVLRHLVGLQTTFDVWQTLESRYASHLKSQILCLRTQLQSTKKGGLSINEYWLKMKIIADDLEAAGEFVHETDFAYYILGGLGPEFDPVSENINSRLDSIGLTETSGRNFQFSGLNINAGRCFSPRARFDKGYVGNYNYRNENYNTRGRGFFGRGRCTNRPICQVCKMVGHTGDVCYYRSPVMPESTTGIVVPNLQSYGSMSGLSNPFSYGVSTPLGSSNNISGQVPQQSTGFCVHNGVPHFGAPLSASIGMNYAGYPFMPPMSASIGSNVVDHSSVP